MKEMGNSNLSMFKKFIIQILIFGFLFSGSILLPSIILSTIVKNRKFKNYETESNLLVFEKDKKYDFMFVGISHARNFSRHKNHLRIEKILNKKFINIGQGAAMCGANEQFFYLDYFYKKENSVKTVVYILSPPLLFSEILPISAKTFVFEPFEMSFFLNYIFFKTENKQKRLRQYVKSKFKKKWLNYQPYTLNSKDEKLVKLDSIAVKEGFEITYPNGLNFDVYQKSCEAIENTVKLSLANNSKIILLIPPALFGKWQGHKETVNFAEAMKTKYDVQFYDYSEMILEPKYYYDHHHLNTNGIIYFTEKYLKPIL